MIEKKAKVGTGIVEIVGTKKKAKVGTGIVGRVVKVGLGESRVGVGCRQRRPAPVQVFSSFLLTTMQCNASQLLVDYYCHVQIVQYIKYIFTGWMFPSFVP